MVPHQQDRCWIKVDGIQRHWAAGEVPLFDDTYKHEVANDTDEDRVILLLHLRRPRRLVLRR